MLGNRAGGCSCLALCRGRGRGSQIDTRHYRVHTDLDDALARELGQLLDNMSTSTPQRLAILGGESAMPRLEVFLFQTQWDYLKFSRGRLKNTGGVFVPDQNLLAAFLELQGRDGIRRTLQHEAFHQFAFNAISPELPIWLNEGLRSFSRKACGTATAFCWARCPAQAPPASGRS